MNKRHTWYGYYEIICFGYVNNRGENMINKNMIIDDILYKYPQMEKVFKEAGIRCFG